MNLFRSTEEPTISGTAYLVTLHKYLSLNLSRLAPPVPGKQAFSETPSWLQQSYTLLTLGLDPSSAPLSKHLKVPLTLGFGTSQTAPRLQPAKPFLLRLPPDRLLYLLLRWQSCREPLPHVGRTDEPIAPGVPVAARGAKVDAREKRNEGDVRSVRSWVGSMRSVSMASTSWWRREEEVDENKILLALYTVFTVLPALLIHPPFLSDPPIAELIDAGGYTQLGGIDVRVPLDVLRNLQILELEAYDPRGLLIPPNPALKSLTVRDVQDADEWLEELLLVLPEPTPPELTPNPEPDSPAFPDMYPSRFPNLRHLSLHSTTLLSFPTVPLRHLVALDLSHNLLNALPSSLSTLSSLQSLNLSNNLITSVRNAPHVLGNITSLNLSHNRIDCLVGLERVLGLERIDSRWNNIEAWDEVGRLSELPHLKEVWCDSNPFTAETWRVELGAAFAREGRKVVFDDRPWTWNESNRIETLLQSRGQVPRSRPLESTVSAEPANAGPSRSQSPMIHSGSARDKKRRPRRVIQLDSAEAITGDLSHQEDSPSSSSSPAMMDYAQIADRSAAVNAATAPTVRVKKKERGKASLRGLFDESVG
ncbi:hypothetical protein BD324DRAFT_652205 [Kockovaella imperatae]|uniref:Uncharacterized protein n=1 Tax=Kockovaella imperatae TaxID=4999 RepID=A0A1Y1UDN5_9TREE|nr:hypothetical protein BD324DRAFT_652205 [Kockovaella imperatae]ORX35657.1 hypothetical protein BD324DRAFT_652205 [Kockovaella imperatae]